MTNRSRRNLATTLFLLAGLSFGSLTGISIAQPTEEVTFQRAWQAGWPQSPGPNWDFSALDTGVPLLEDINKGVVVWEAEGQFGRAKAYSSKDKGIGSAGLPTGGGYGPIMHRGRIFQWSYLPTGKQAAYPDGRGRDFPRNVTASVDLHLLAIDPANGKTLWRRIVPDVGANFQGGKSVEPANQTPAAADGHIFARGRDGRLYAFDAEDGAMQWSRVIPGEFAEQQDKRAADLIADAAGDHHAHGEGHGLVTVIGGAVLIRHHGLHAFDAQSGKPLWHKDWHMSRTMYPVPWHGPSGTRLLVSTKSGIHCVEPMTGKVLWTDGKALPAQTRLFVHENDLVIQVENVLPKMHKREPGKCFYNGNAPVGMPACYRIGEKGLTRLWGTVDRFDGTAKSVLACSALQPDAVFFYRGMVWLPMATEIEAGFTLKENDQPLSYALQGKVRTELIAHDRGSKSPVDLVALDLKTGGERLRLANASTRLGGGGAGAMCMQRMGERVLNERDTGHEQPDMLWLTIGEKPEQLSKREWNLPFVTTVPYGNILNRIMLDGRIVVRHNKGLLCYDARADRDAGHTPAPLAAPAWANELPESLRGLTSPHLTPRGAAIDRLVASDEALDAKALTVLLAKGDRIVRRAVRRLLSERAERGATLAKPSGLPALLKTLVAESPLARRRAAMLALTALDPKAARAPLTKLLADPDPAVVTTAARGLAVAGADADQLAALAKRTDAKNAPIAYACAEAIRRIAQRGDIDEAAAKKVVEALPAPADYSANRKHMAAALAATALGKPAKPWLVAVIDAQVKSGKVDYQLSGTLAEGLVAIGESPEHASIAAAAKANKVVAQRLQRQAVTRARRLSLEGEALPEPYTKFWKAIDADIKAAGAPQPVW